jgi:hypothetical protein
MRHTPRAHRIAGTAWLLRLLDQYFYFSMSLLIAAVVMYGFSHTVDKNLIHPTIPRPFVVYIHAVVFVGWVVFFILQTTLVRTGKVRWHRTMGRWIAVLGAVVAVLGIWTAFTMERFNMLQLHRPVRRCSSSFHLAISSSSPSHLRWPSIGAETRSSTDA